MEIALRSAAVAVIGSILALLLRRHTPELSLGLSVCTGLLCAGLCVGICGEIAETLRSLAVRSGVSAVLLAPVAKCVGIALVTELAAQVCRDAQQGAAASFAELCGTLCALYAALPLLRSLAAVVGGLL